MIPSPTMIGAGAVALIIGGLVLRDYVREQKIDGLEQTIVRRDETIQRTNTQNKMLNEALFNARVDEANAKELLEQSDAIASAAQKRAQQLEADISASRRSIRNAPEEDDGPAAPVLDYATNSLRAAFEAIESMRAGNNNEGTLATNPD